MSKGVHSQFRVVCFSDILGTEALSKDINEINVHSASSHHKSESKQKHGFLNHKDYKLKTVQWD